MSTNRQVKLGLLGGMSWESSARYYELLNREVERHLGGLHSADCIMDSQNFAVIAELQHSGKWEEAGAILATSARRLESAGARGLLLCTNTMHIVADQIQSAVNIPLIHIADVTAAALRAKGIREAGFLGTSFAMEKPFLLERFAGHGIKTIVPDKEDRELVNSVIYNELCRGITRLESLQAYKKVMQRLIERGAEGIILGCTEIENLVRDESYLSKPLFPTTTIHAKAGVAFSLGQFDLAATPLLRDL